MQIYLSRSVTKRIPETLSRQDITGRNAEVSGIANFKVEDFSLERSARVLEWYNAELYVIVVLRLKTLFY